MNNRWLPLINVSLVAFAGLALAWQFLHCDRKVFGSGSYGPLSSIAQSCIRGEQMAKVSDIVKRDQMIIRASGLCRYVDLVLPKNARVFMPDMTGPTNLDKIMNYYYVIYYLFPREVGVSVDQPTHLTKDGFLGRTAVSDEEILTNGYDAVIDFPPDETLTLRLLRPLSELPIKEPANPEWFDSHFDLIIAFLLPLLTALAGMWLFRFLFPTLTGQIPLLEQLAYGLGLGMMAVAALTLGIKLCGWHGYHLVFLTAAVGAGAEIWRHRKAYWTGMTDGCRKLARRPVVIGLLVTGLLVFLILFRLSGLQGIVEYDSVMAWLPKAKIIHLYTGSGLVQWFSNPRLAHAHLDYPTLVPSLHAATFDSLGHVDEFVTKFWPTWMLLFLLGGLVSLNRGGERLFYAPYFALLGILLLPTIQRYVQWEGGTLPMIFFTVLGFMQCAFWLIGKDRARLGLGLTLLFGGAMSHFEGFIFLALVESWLLLVPSAQTSLKPSPRLWRMLVFCSLAALPFACLRVRIPVLHFESGWAGYALHNPGVTLSNCPWIFMILFARLFVNPAFANWGGEDGRLHWIGRWDGLTSLYNHSTLGLAWLCLLMTIVLWFALPARRRVLVWILAMLVGALASFSLVFSSLYNVTSLAAVIGYTKDHIAGRYLLPILMAWFAIVMTLCFMEPPGGEPASGTDTIVPLDAATGPKTVEK